MVSGGWTPLVTVTSVPSVTNVFFMDCRDAYRFVRCGFVYVNVCYGVAFMYAAAQLCCRALVMLPRTRMFPLIRGAAHSHTAALHGAAHLYAAAHPWRRACGQMVSSSTCCRAPWCRSVLCVAAFHAAAQFSVLPRPMLPRPMLPRSSTCCRVPCCRAVPCVAASHGAAQFYMLLRPMLPSYVLRAAAPRSLVPRSSTCCRAPWCRARHNALSLRLFAARWSGLL